MNHVVVLLEAAEWDLFDIHQYIEQHDSPESADRLLDDLERCLAGLDTLPERGHYPPELERVGIHLYREIHFKPYRIIYAIEGDRVVVYGVLDGRRDMQTILQRRVLRSR
ncbi:MAG: type II toxin-antitoxin system RelE/ParE family toxin [Desulfuromonadales bacterium]|nr:type II toxin-antitoxin system RelE/ParE family toxin [Desulfuromonadales bacterium]